MAHKILIVEDDHALRDVLRRALTEEGFVPVPAADGATALKLATQAIAAVVLDIGLPDADGRDVCQALRANGLAAPVLFLTARGHVTDRLAGFAAGGDDYLGKPFHLRELIARTNALLKRSAPTREQQAGGIEIDPISLGATVQGHQVPLSPTEFRLLAVLVAAHGSVVRRRELLGAGWPDGAWVSDNTLDQYVSRLRRKLREAGSTLTVRTQRGIGHSLA
ncbi:response regulator transcription factor [Streptomyces sp. SID14478]|uniref:response regulator transcription factor n=1 Tax=Streptomyces sp. SID14478 TaxID=2706073 RepID=UPI0013DB1AB3|nr:response regulator transcription factor [Streptomyces sp. SID14478]NEB73652.1 response regulator transcription factor [Streptomyces sp. SID14478]